MFSFLPFSFILSYFSCYVLCPFILCCIVLWSCVLYLNCFSWITIFLQFVLSHPASYVLASFLPCFIFSYLLYSVACDANVSHHEDIQTTVSSFPQTLDQLCTRSSAHQTLSHLDKENGAVRIMFFNFSSASKTF